MSAINNSVLTVRHLETVFRQNDEEVRVVNDVSFDIRQGEIVALVGESGSGKSVSALSILGLLPGNGRVIGGVVEFEGNDLLRLPRNALRAMRGKKISMVFQDPRSSLNPIHTIGRQIAEALQLHMGLDRGEAWNRAGVLLHQVGITDVDACLRSYPHQLSGGMCQRVMIATALSTEPKILLADEPTTALDVTTQAQILELMRSRAAETGTAILLITHDLGVVARYAQRMNVMYAGQIVEHGSVRDVFRSPAMPYTRNLLAAVPRVDLPRTDRKRSRSGDVSPAFSEGGAELADVQSGFAGS